jgi:hypothetical protein
LTAFRYTIENVLNTSSPNLWTYTVTFPDSTDANTGKWTFKVSGNTGQQPKIIVHNHCYKQFGFEINSTNSFVNDTLESTNVIYLQAEGILFLKSDLVAGANDELLKISAGNVPDFGTIEYTDQSPETYSKILSSSLNQTPRFTLVNADNIPIDFNGQHIIMRLLFYYESDVIESLRDFMKLQVLQQNQIIKSLKILSKE